MTFKLYSRDEFRERVFTRDGHKCVVCGKQWRDHLNAHHILERRLWGESGGYYLENGASVCEPCHMEAEATSISCERLRELCGITKFPIPDHLYADTVYDKWANPVLPNGTRLKGELFEDPSVQKVIAPVLSLFTNRVKPPRTFHLPWSPGVTDDDRVMGSLEAFEGQDVVVTGRWTEKIPPSIGTTGTRGASTIRLTRAATGCGPGTRSLRTTSPRGGA